MPAEIRASCLIQRVFASDLLLARRSSHHRQLLDGWKQNAMAAQASRDDMIAFMRKQMTLLQDNDINKRLVRSLSQLKTRGRT